jgi:hypothetical protein
MPYLSEKMLRGLLGKVYRALLTQAGTAAPTAVVLVNQIGAIVWARTGVGTYTATLAGAFLAGKTLIRSMAYDQATGKMLSGVRTDNNTITFKNGVAAGAASDVFADVLVEIVVYE